MLIAGFFLAPHPFPLIPEVMYWQEKTEKAAYVVPEDVVDVLFRMDAPRLPLDHAWALREALFAILPWLADEPLAGIHLIHGAESGNGWERPSNPDADVLHLPRRARMALRLPRERTGDARTLSGATLDIAGYPLAVGESSLRSLLPLTTVFARHVAGGAAGEQEFLDDCYRQLRDLGITVRKLLCGRSHELRTPEGPVRTRSLMLADLEVEDSVRLQERGLGPHRTLGCGLFLGHKSVRPVNSAPADD
jgi:CRISPR-associated protein Cas6